MPTPEEVAEQLKPNYIIGTPTTLTAFQKMGKFAVWKMNGYPAEPWELAESLAQARKERDVLKQALEEIKTNWAEDSDDPISKIAEKALASINKDFSPAT